MRLEQLKIDMEQLEIDSPVGEAPSPPPPPPPPPADSARPPTVESPRVSKLGVRDAPLQMFSPMSDLASPAPLAVSTTTLALITGAKEQSQRRGDTGARANAPGGNLALLTNSSLGADRSGSLGSGNRFSTDSNGSLSTSRDLSDGGGRSSTGSGTSRSSIGSSNGSSLSNVSTSSSNALGIKRLGLSGLSKPRRVGPLSTSAHASSAGDAQKTTAPPAAQGAAAGPKQPATGLGALPVKQNSVQSSAFGQAAARERARCASSTSMAGVQSKTQEASPLADLPAELPLDFGALSLQPTSETSENHGVSLLGDLPAELPVSFSSHALQPIREMSERMRSVAEDVAEEDEDVEAMAEEREIAARDGEVAEAELTPGGEAMTGRLETVPSGQSTPRLLCLTTPDAEVEGSPSVGSPSSRSADDKKGALTTRSPNITKMAALVGEKPTAAATGATAGRGEESTGVDDERRRLAWWLVMTTLEADAVVLLLPQVCRTFRELSDEAVALSSLLSCLPGAASCAPRDYADIAGAFPAGRFLAEGGFKRVYKVRNATQRRYEAMGVLDLRHMRKLGLEQQLINELWTSFLLSQLSRRGRCPHFLQLYQCYQSSSAPPSQQWGDIELPSGESLLVGTESSASDDDDDEAAVEAAAAEAAAAVEAAAAEAAAAEAAAKPRRAAARKPAVVQRKPPVNTACYQYVLMQFAEFGDCEEACKLEAQQRWPAEELPPMLFQMLFALHVAQHELTLRHYDVKLLNFFLAAAPTPARGSGEGRESGEGEGEGSLELVYGYEGQRYRFEFAQPSPKLVMLADFGTADTSPETYGKPMEAAHFTTLENTPPDFLLCGADAVQSFAADAFGLGLCLLHLLTGRAPYEELIAPLKCPAELKSALEAVWCDEGDSRYAPVKQVLEGSDEEGVLYHTLYRYLCMFGTSAAEGPAEEAEVDEAGAEGERGKVRESAVWAAITAWLGTSSGKSRFGRDHGAWSVFEGRQKIMVEAQRRMAALPGRCAQCVL